MQFLHIQILRRCYPVEINTEYTTSFNFHPDKQKATEN